MHSKLLLHLLARASLAMAAAFIVPYATGIATASEANAFMAASLIAVFFGCLFWHKGTGAHRSLSAKESAMLLFALWLVMIFFGMLPFVFLGKLGPADAFFEAASFVTTTGIGLMANDASNALKLWCVMLAWLGALNYLIAFVTILPQAAGEFGIRLAFRRGYTFSPVLGQMEDVAKQIAGIYAGFTALAALLYFLSGMSAADSIEGAMLTVSVTDDGSTFFAETKNPWPKTAATILLFLAGGNIFRYWRTIRRREFRDFYQNAESRFFISTIAAASVIIAFQLIAYGGLSIFSAFHLAVFESLSFASTAGCAATNLADWPDISKYSLLLLSFMGGCMGSPTGGLKVMRIIILLKMLAAETRRTLHPHMVAHVVVGGRSVSPRFANRVTAFFFIYVAAFFVFVLLLALAGNDLSESVGMAAACFTNTGTNLGLYAADAFSAMQAPGKIICALFMVAARMEVFAFWLLLRAMFFERKRKW